MNGLETRKTEISNQNNDVIKYLTSDGVAVEITFKQFLAESPDNTVEKFELLKITLAEFAENEATAEWKKAKYEVPFFECSGKFITESLEEAIEQTSQKAHEEYLSLCDELLKIVPEVLGNLTETQRKRFLLHKVKGLTIRKIADIEGVYLNAVAKSLTGAENKIKKYLLKNGFSS